MSFRAMAWAWEQRSLSPPDRLVLLALADRHNSETGACFPSLRRVAEDANLSERAVRLALRALEEAGLIKAEPRKAEDGRQLSSAYVLNQGAPHAGEGAQDAPGRGHSVPGQGAPHAPKPGIVTMEGKESSLRSLSVREGAIESDFEIWWQAYPRKEGKGAARKAYGAAVKKVDSLTLRTALMRPWPEEARFIPHPATWLNQERWADAPQAQPQRSASRDPFADWRMDEPPTTHFDFDGHAEEAP